MVFAEKLCKKRMWWAKNRKAKPRVEPVNTGTVESLVPAPGEIRSKLQDLRVRGSQSPYPLDG